LCKDGIQDCSDIESYHSGIKPEYYFAAKKVVQSQPDLESVHAYLLEHLGAFTYYSNQKRINYRKRFVAANQFRQQEINQVSPDVHPFADYRLEGQPQDRKGRLKGQAKEYFSQTSALDDPAIVHQMEGLLERVNYHRLNKDYLTLEQLRELLHD